MHKIRALFAFFFRNPFFISSYAFSTVSYTHLYYSAQGKLSVVEGQEEVADTTKLTLAALKA